MRPAVAVAVRITVPPHEVLFGHRRPERSLAGSRSSDAQCAPAHPSKHAHVPFAPVAPLVQTPLNMQSAEDTFEPTPRKHDPPPPPAKEEVSSVKTWTSMPCIAK